MPAILFPDFNPIAIAIGPFAIRWYALAYIVGLLIGWRYCLWVAKRPPAVASPQAIDDFLVWATLGVVLGGRLGYVLFYKPDFYFHNPSEIIKLWHGGMSFHGGALGVMTALIFFCRQRGLSLLAFSDIITPAVPIGIFFGRIANFINGELWGRPTDEPWGVIYPGAGMVPRHPSELYEADARRPRAVPDPVLFRALHQRAREAGPRLGRVPHRLCLRAHLLRVLPRARRIPRLPLVRRDHGPAPVDSRVCARPVAGVAREAGAVNGGAADDFAARLVARIREQGPISIADYMRQCNAHYYATRDPFGAAGDFTTAPEISQVFGELIGAWCADYWQRMGAPDPVLLVELGPGRGTLMADALRATRRVPGFHDALKLHLVEQSPVLRAMQEEKLAAYQPQFHDHMGTVPNGAMLLIANEFFDALPVVQFERRNGVWHERRIAFDEAIGALALRTDPQPSRMGPDPAGKRRMARCWSCSRMSTDADIAIRLRDHGGAALIIDYGYYPSQSADTLQALRQHKPVSIVESPGEVDLTAHVNFHMIEDRAASNGATAYGPATQAQFLIALGIAAREAALLKNAAPEQQEAIRSGCRRLIEPAQMGTLFKVLALTQKGGPVPAGFGAAS